MKTNRIRLLLILIGLVFGSCILVACGDAEDKQEKNDDCKHSFGEWETIKESTCKERGEKKRVCEKCQYEETDTIKKIPHKEVIDKAVAATCYVGGKTEGSHCEVCNEIIVKQEDIEPSHNIIEEDLVVVQEATCEEKGKGQVTCSECGGVANREIEALGHLPNDEFICERCGKETEHEYELNDEERVETLKVEYIGDRSVQVDNENLTILFSLMDKNEVRMAAPVIVETRIVNENNETVYSGTKLVKMTDFATWQSAFEGNRLLGSVEIPLDKIKEGSTTEGTVYFKVFNSILDFGESSVSTMELPKKMYSVVIPEEPFEVYYKLGGTKYSGCKITSVKVTEKYDSEIVLKYSGEKIYDSSGKKNNEICWFSYKVTDSNGVIVASETIMTDAYCVGDRFKDETVYIYGTFEPNETYTIRFFDYGN